MRTLDIEAQSTVDLPTMLVLSEKDALGRVEVQRDGATKWAKDVRVEVVEGGHWIPIEDAEKLNQLLESFAMELGSRGSNP